MRTPRYGIKIRRRIDEILREKRKVYKCPNCKRMALRRTASGIWECKKCGFKIASKAYKFEEIKL